MGDICLDVGIGSVKQIPFKYFLYLLQATSTKGHTNVKTHWALHRHPTLLMKLPECSKYHKAYLIMKTNFRSKL